MTESAIFLLNIDFFQLYLCAINIRIVRFQFCYLNENLDNKMIGCLINMQLNDLL